MPGGDVQSESANLTPREHLKLARASAAVVSDLSGRASRFRVCHSLLSAAPHKAIPAEFVKAIERLDENERHFWIGTFYTLLLPAQVRRSQAAYFTPPHLTKALLRLLQKEGFDPLQHSVIDPAAGGAAFLSTIAAEMRAKGLDTKTIQSRLRGVEIDRGLARLAEALIQSRIDSVVKNGRIVSVKDSLRMKVTEKFDLVVANPPFGRLYPDDLPDQRWEKVCHPGHINKYALFAELCLRLAKPGALLALVLPSSFLAGPLYGRLREHIRSGAELLTLGSLTQRNDIFVDVAQDVSILIARVGTPHPSRKSVSFGSFAGLGTFKPSSMGTLPAQITDAWVSRSHKSKRGGATLDSYGAVLRAGYFVWNRELDRMRTRGIGRLTVPLVWAFNIKANRFCRPSARKRRGVDFVKFHAESTGITRTDAIVIQRTTNNSQKRRIVASRIAPSVLRKHGGFATENHTIVLTGPPVRTLNLLVWLLNSAAIDKRYRQVSGTASVSVTLLRELDLPTPFALQVAVAVHGYTDIAIEAAYATADLSEAVA